MIGRTAGQVEPATSHLSDKVRSDSKITINIEQVNRFVSWVQFFALMSNQELEQYSFTLAEKAKRENLECKKILKNVAQKIRIKKLSERQDRLIDWLIFFSLNGNGVGDTVKRLLPSSDGKEIHETLKRMTHLCGCAGIDWVNWLNEKYPIRTRKPASQHGTKLAPSIHN